MVIKALGAEIKRFYSDIDYVFPQGEVIHDEGELDIYELSDFTEYPLTWDNFGCFMCESINKTISFASAFTDWKEKQTHVHVFLEIPKEKEEYVLTWLRTITPEIKIIK